MISGQQIIAIAGLFILGYLIFYVIPMPPVVRNVLGIVLAVVLFVVLLNLLGVLAL
jgi:hypothetical protein